MLLYMHNYLKCETKNFNIKMPFKIHRKKKKIDMDSIFYAGFYIATYTLHRHINVL